jgi:hypothetical protein
MTNEMRIVQILRLTQAGGALSGWLSIMPIRLQVI